MPSLSVDYSTNIFTDPIRNVHVVLPDEWHSWTEDQKQAHINDVIHTVLRKNIDVRVEVINNDPL